MNAPELRIGDRVRVTDVRHSSATFRACAIGAIGTVRQINLTPTEARPYWILTLGDVAATPQGPRRISWLLEAQVTRLAPEDEVRELAGTELTCEIADAWVDARKSDALHVTTSLASALDRLEAITRHSALRKVRP